MKWALLLCLPFAACAGFSGNEQKGTYSAVFFGTDFKGYSQSSGKAEVAEANQSNTTIPAIRTAGTLGTAAIAANLAEAVSADNTAVSLGSQKVERSKNAGQAATNQLKIKEATKIKTFVPPPL